MQPVIAGAGPVGMTAALFLSRGGVIPRIIDWAAGPSPHSRALAVNPRTLEILEPTGITTQMLSVGKPIHGVCFRQGSNMIGKLSFHGLHHKYPFMLALSQAVTARLLESSLNASGVRVEWNLGLVHCRSRSDGVEVKVKSADDAKQAWHCPWLLAADGAHSTAREELGIRFGGSSFGRRWHLVDIPLATSLPEEFAHVLFLKGGGFLFLIRVIDEPERSGQSDPVWRVMGNVPDLLSRLETGKPTGPPVWSSEFHISHRINDRMQQGPVYFAGDAAHVHSPIGARGMNLGIEDAWTFSQLLQQGEMSRYGQLRHSIDQRVVRRIELLSRLARGESVGSRLLRSTALPAMIRIPGIRHRIVAMVTGLDHPLYPAAIAHPSTTGSIK